MLGMLLNIVGLFGTQVQRKKGSEFATIVCKIKFLRHFNITTTLFFMVRNYRGRETIYRIVRNPREA